jgi:hypothetical protein
MIMFQESRSETWRCIGNFSKRMGPLVQHIVVAERRNSARKERSSIREAPIDNLGISTWVLLETPAIVIRMHYPNIEDMPDVTSVDKIVEVKRVSLV